MTTKIEWTDDVWNITTGCTKDCPYCYARRMAHRLAGRYGYPAAPDEFKVTLHPEKLNEPLRWKKPRRIFVDSMGDLFDPGVSDKFIDSVFVRMKLAWWHTFIILTKFPDRMHAWFTRHTIGGWSTPEIVRHDAITLRGEDSTTLSQVWPLINVWLGVSAENQSLADRRIPWLLQTPAAVRFVNCEPLLGPVDLSQWLGNSLMRSDKGDWWAHHGQPMDLHWVLCGGESGQKAHPMHPDWARGLRDQCLAAGVLFFFKQWGEYSPAGMSVESNGEWLTVGQVMLHVGKKRAGRRLDGVAWSQYPGGVK